MPITDYTIADIMGAVVILIGIIFGFKKGLSTLMAFVFSGLSVAAALYNGFSPTRDWLTLHFSLPAETARLVAIILLVTLPLLAIMLIYGLLRYLLKITFTTWFDRLCGAIAGGVTSAAIVLLIFILAHTLPANRCPDVMGSHSWITREILGAETQLVQKVTSRIEKGENIIERAREARAGKREKWEE